MRTVLATALVLLVLATGIAPHVHEGPLGRHTCVACVVASSDPATSATPDLAPLPRVESAVVLPPPELRGVGAPLGAVPGQSPPRV
ncbi:MAG TPA: hypothetical protein VMG32_08810 [Anaeromyxobacteraceae bacterium]|nr:hypothetical protein [Anaeromyxobacteraceae bacterium]